MRKNNEVESAFQKDISDIFLKHGNELSFSAMLDVLISWMAYNVQHNFPAMNKEDFIKIAGLTWDGVADDVKSAGGIQ